MDQLVDFIFQNQQTSAAEQEQLRQIQKGPNGFAVANELIHSPNINARFVGAQTFHIQLNANAQFEQDKFDLMLNCLQFTTLNSPKFVTRKILTAFAKLYLLHQFDLKQVLLNTSNDLQLEFLIFLVEECDATQKLSLLNLQAVDLAVEMVKINWPALPCFEAYAQHFLAKFELFLNDLINLMFQTDLEFQTRLLQCVYLLVQTNKLKLKPSFTTSLVSKLNEFAFKYDEKVQGYIGLSDFGLSFVRLVMLVIEEVQVDENLLEFLVKCIKTSTSIADDLVANELLEFWNQFTEELISNGMTTSELVVRVIDGYWPRIKLNDSIPNEDINEFLSFRKDFADFLELAYPLLGLQLFEHLTEVVLRSIELQDWMAIESALFCLNGLSEIVGEDYSGETLEFGSVKRIFQSQLWEELPKCSNLRVRQTAVNTIGCFVDFFKGKLGIPYLAVTLNYLFNSMATQFLQNTSSRSILKLCDACRLSLQSEVYSFINVYKSINHQLLDLPHIRTVAAVACVIQCVEDDFNKLKYAMEMFELVTRMQPNNLCEDVLLFEQTRLKCIATLGKHLNSPNQCVLSTVDLELQTLFKPNLKEIILTSSKSSDVGVNEAICEILKVCFFDEVYSCDEEFVLSFIKLKLTDPLNLEIALVVMDLAKAFVATRLSNLKQKCLPQLSLEGMRVLFEIAYFVGERCFASSIELLKLLFETFANHEEGMQAVPPDLTQYVKLVLKGMASSDRFVLKSAVSFFKQFLTSFSFDLEIISLLVRTLLIQASGNASRSEIPFVVDVFKLLMQKHPQQSELLLKTMAIDEPIGRQLPKQDLKTRRDFVAQMVLVKGGRKTGDIVQNFWLRCRNLQH